MYLYLSKDIFIGILMYLKSAIKRLLLKKNVHLRIRLVAFVLLIVWTFIPIVLFPNNPERFGHCILSGYSMILFHIPGIQLFLGILIVFSSLFFIISLSLNHPIIELVNFHYLFHFTLPLITGILIIVAWKIKKSQTNS